MSLYPVGIDLGDYKTVVSIVRDNGVDIVLNEVANRSSPSLVSYGQKSRFFGEEAKNQTVQNYQTTVSSLKYLIGQHYASAVVKREQAFNSCKFIKTERDAPGIEAFGFTYDSNQSYIGFLSYVRKTIIAFTNGVDKIGKVVITIPSHYNLEQRQVINEAAHIAGFRDVATISEPLAIGLTYSIKNHQEKTVKTILFVDAGYSHLDLSLINIGEKFVEVIATASTQEFSGRLIDHIIVKKLLERGKMNFRVDSKPYQRLLKDAEKFKKILSANTSVSVNIESVYNDNDIITSIKRSEFEEWLEPSLQNIKGLFKQVVDLGANRIQDLNISEIELIGGCARIPVLKELIKQTLNTNDLSTTLNQDESISNGAVYSSTIFTKGLQGNTFVLKELVLNNYTFYWEKKLKDEESSFVVDKYTNFPAEFVIYLERSKDFEIRLNINNTKSDFRVWRITQFKEAAPDLVRITIKISAQGLISLHASQVEPTEKVKSFTKFFKKQTQEPKFKTIHNLHVSLKHHHAFQSPQFHHYVATEKKLRQLDLDEQINKETKNKLESTIYKSRHNLDKLDENTQAEVSKYLEDLENWLYEDGEEETTEVYESKFAELEKTMAKAFS